MSRVLLRTGKRAEIPYRLQMIDREVYTVEELCYCLAQCADFLDDRVMDPALVNWITSECGLPELGSRLEQILRTAPRLFVNASNSSNASDSSDSFSRSAIRHREPAGSGTKKYINFVMTILDSTHYQPPAQRAQIRLQMENSRGMKPYEEQIQEAGGYAKEGQRGKAQEIFDDLLEELPGIEHRTRAGVWKHKGILYADGFDFAKAAGCFAKAWDLSHETESGFFFLAALNLSSSEEYYDRYIQEHPELYEISRQVRERIAQAQSAYRNGSESRQIRALQKYRKDHQDSTFAVQMQRRIRELTEHYRETNASPF